MISFGRAEPVVISKHGRPVVFVMSDDETRREQEECNAFLDPNVADEEGQRLPMPGRAGA